MKNELTTNNVKVNTLTFGASRTKKKTSTNTGKQKNEEIIIKKLINVHIRKQYEYKFLYNVKVSPLTTTLKLL